ncbi:MAG TPA: hypothetical protein PK507_03395 [bacterium]|jgi:hypothetical protein|nr:hypothetical protein [bacterium]
MTKMTGEEMAKSFSDFVNSFDTSRHKEFAEKLCYNTHRTLQQSSMAVMMECMKLWAEMYDKGWYDLRNEQTCKLAKKIVDEFKDEIYMPFI